MLLTIQQTLGGRDPGETAKKKFQACAIRVLVGLDIDTEFLTNDRSVSIYVCNNYVKQLERGISRGTRKRSSKRWIGT